MSAGPCETERHAADAARHITSLPPGAWRDGNHRLLYGALSAAGVELGAFDHAIVRWICGWEPSTVPLLDGGSS